ncbi:MAG: hypothetical protein HFJ32_02910 [Clostridia bacterium]|nr:hypothetical protein [Clostridia bacterium]
MWNEINEMAKEIANDNSITNSSTQATMTIDGESKTISVGGIYKVKYGTTEKRVRVLGFKHDDLVDTGVYGGNHSKASISFEFFDYMTGTSFKQMNSSKTNSGGWANTQMRRDLNGSGNTIGGLGVNLSNRAYIKQVKKRYIATYNKAGSVTICNDYLWLLAASEVWSNGYQSGAYGYTITSEGARYQYYKSMNPIWNKSSNCTVKYPSASGGTAKWWLRSPYYLTNQYFCVMAGQQDGIAFANDTAGVAPGFCI